MRKIGGGLQDSAGDEGLAANSEGQTVGSKNRQRPSDEFLMQQFQAGNISAFDSLVERHLAFVHRHARRYLKDGSSAEDIAQEVFLRLYKSRDLFRDPNNFLGWLATITTRLALNELRTRTRKRWTPRSTLVADDRAQDQGREWQPGRGSGTAGLEQDFQVSDAHHIGEAKLLLAERHQAVHLAIEQLPDRQRLAIWLQRFEGWDLQQLSVALEMSIPAVKSLLHRARISLRTLLEPYMAAKPKTLGENSGELTRTPNIQQAQSVEVNKPSRSKLIKGLEEDGATGELGWG